MNLFRSGKRSKTSERDPLEDLDPAGDKEHGKESRNRSELSRTTRAPRTRGGKEWVRTRNVQIALRVTPAVRQRLDDLADRTGMTITEIFEFGLGLAEEELAEKG